MASSTSSAEINIHLRARAEDRDLIDRAADLVSANRSQFMLSSALREARNVLLDRASIEVDAKAFQKILAWIDSEPSESEKAGMKKLRDAAGHWPRG